MQKTPKISPKTKRILLGIAAVLLIAALYFLFPNLFRNDTDIPDVSSSSLSSTAADISTSYDTPESTSALPESSVAETTSKPTPETTSKPAPETTAKPSAETTAKAPAETTAPAEQKLDKNGTYTSKEDVALYIHQYGELPQNFITKAEAQKLGWTGGSLEKYAPGKCIGGDNFGNYEGLLPKKSGRKYTECDIDTLGASSRGAKRIVFSNDGLIYYTDDHYATFTLLYGNE